MSYDVGTHIDLSHLNDPGQQPEHAPAAEQRSALWVPGTRILFVNWVPRLSTMVILPA